MTSDARRAQIHRRTAIIVWFIGICFVKAASLAAQSVVPDVLYLRFDEGSGPVAYDEALPGTGAVANIAIAPINTFPATLASGSSIIGSGSLLTGTASATGVLLQNATAPFSTSFTIEFWSENVPGSAFFPCGNACSSTIGLSTFYTRFDTLTNGTVNILAAVGFTGYQWNVPLLPGIGNWRHWALAQDGSTNTFRVYENGTLVQTQSGTIGPVLATMFQYWFAVGGLGIAPGSCAGFQTAAPTRIDDFRVWSYVRTQQQIIDFMNADFGALSRVGSVQGAKIIPNPATLTYSATTPITRVGYLGEAESATTVSATGIIAPATTMTVSGTYTGNDLTTLGDWVFNATTRIVVAPGTDELIIQSAHSVATGLPIYSEFVGDSPIPSLQRSLPTTVVPIASRIGNGSVWLDRLAAAVVARGEWSLLVDVGPNGPAVSTAGYGFVVPTPKFDFRMATNGTGDVMLGDAGCIPNADLRHIFVLQPTIPVGTGPFYGLELSPLIFTELGLPLTTTPFHVRADPFGAYFFYAGPGSLPPGFVADAVGFDLGVSTTATASFSAVRRVTF